jgi:hypothetical protein
VLEAPRSTTSVKQTRTKHWAAETLKFDGSVHVAHRDRLDVGEELLTHPAPQRPRHVRDAAEHFCPWYSNAPRSIATRSTSTSAEGWATMKSLPPVSPSTRGYERYVEMFSPTVRHRY